MNYKDMNGNEISVGDRIVQEGQHARRLEGEVVKLRADGLLEIQVDWSKTLNVLGDDRILCVNPTLVRKI